MDNILDTQLSTFLTDRIDYSLLHHLPASLWEKMKNLGIREFFSSAKDEARIKNAGFSFHGDLSSFKDCA
jgi:hypothetical protein